MSNDVENYSPTAASNTTDFYEGQAPATLNDGGRETQADVRRWYDRIAGTVVAAGTVDALTATFSPVHTALYDGREVVVRAAGANTITNPTFQLDSLTAKTITLAGNQALVAGDIRGAGHYLRLKYNTANDVWELLNPYYGGAIGIAAGTSPAPEIKQAALEAGANQCHLVYSAPVNTNAGTWTTIANQYMYIPATAITLHYRFQCYTSAGISEFRLLATATGTTTTATNTSLGWSTEVETMDVTADSGWTLVNVQTRVTSGPASAYVGAVAIYFE